MSILVSIFALFWCLAVQVSADGAVIARCKNEYDLSHSQRAVCLRQPDLIPVIEGAEEAAREACGQQFRNDRWNCSGFEFLQASPARTYASRESAFMYALMGAAVAKQTGKACRKGSLSSCLCGQSAALPPSDSKTHYYWGCSENLAHGLKVSEDFLDVAETDKGLGLREEVHLQNLQAGRAVLVKTSEREPLKCQCHGLTGSCSIKTCWKVAAPLHTIAQQLRDSYERACQVEYGLTSTFSLTPSLQSTCHWPIAEEDLVFSDSSPNYCNPHPEVGSLGTQGRICEPSALASSSGSCQHLCCGRGYVMEAHVEEYPCECQFVYCCHVKCQTCREEVTNYRCR